MEKTELNTNVVLGLPQNYSIAIYGAGILGEDLLEYLKKNRPDVEVKFFIDKKIKGTKIDVYPVAEARKFFKEIDLILIAAIPPNSIEMEKELNDCKYALAYTRILIEPFSRACHREQLFIRENGDVYPCCFVWENNKYKIGNIYDEDLPEKLDSFDEECCCADFKLIKGESLDYYKNLNIELSYVCQAKCAMCCTGSPDVGAGYKFDNYAQLEAIIAKLKPESLWLQGGEILVQPKSLNFLEIIKEKYGPVLHLITNGNNYSKIECAKKLFDNFYVSFVGFQPETYKCLMGLDISKTKKFCEEILASGGNLSVKYLISPINIHELPLFLKWALTLKGLNGIVISDSCTKQYLNYGTNDNYWNKIIQRTRKEILNTLKDKKLPKIQMDLASNNILNLSIPNLNFSGF